MHTIVQVDKITSNVIYIIAFLVCINYFQLTTYLKASNVFAANVSCDKTANSIILFH